MENILEKRKKLIEEYEMVVVKEQQLDDMISNNIRPRDVFYEVDKAHFEFAKDRLVALLFETQSGLYDEIEKLSSSICDFLLRSSRGEETLADAEEKREQFVKLNQRIKSVIGYNDTDIYEMGLAIKDIDGVISVQNMSVLKENLMNFKILRDVAKIYSFEEELELFNLAQAIIERLTSKLQQYKQEEEDNTK